MGQETDSCGVLRDSGSVFVVVVVVVVVAASVLVTVLSK